VFNQATLARVEKQIHDPGVAEFTRKEAINRTTRQKLETLP
jgi:hypothetical protein